MVVREIMKVNNSAVFEKEKDPILHSSQTTIKSSNSEEIRKKRPKMHETVSEITSSSEASQKTRGKLFKLCDLS
jgi:predicted component of viral defense system (DUF524 family)